MSRGQTDASRGRGGRPKEPLVNRLCQAVATDLISVAGHSLQLHQTPIEDRCSHSDAAENSRTRKSPTS